jgi:hypothetical protein
VLEPHVGGTYRIDMRAPDGSLIPVACYSAWGLTFDRRRSWIPFHAR